MKKEISNIIAKHLKELAGEQELNEIEKYMEIQEFVEIQEVIEIPPQPEMGDFSLPCFSLAKVFHKSPVMIASELKERVSTEESRIIARTEVMNGYLNFFIKPEYYINKVIYEAINPEYGESKEGNGKTICMDYSSPNVAKNFHVGHLRTTIIGNSLYKIYTKLGYSVIRINHLGDWGTQFGKLIVAYKNWSSKEQVEKDGINELLRIYVQFHEEAKKNPVLDDEARSWFVNMENGNEEALEIWKWIIDISIIEFERMYKLLGTQFDYYTGESFYMNQIPALVEELNKKKLLVESQGASIVQLDDYNMPPCLIMKKDGSSIYPSRDLATILYRKKTFNFDKCLYVTGAEQQLHFAQVFKVIELMGYDWCNQLVHIPYGLVSLEGGKLSTRNGNIVYAEDIMKEAISRALSAIEEKNPGLTDKEYVAKIVGVGAVIFHDLFNQRIKDVDFVWDKVLNFEGATGPYVQYTYARAKSILRKSEIDIHNIDFKAEYLTDAVGYKLIKILGDYNRVIKESADRYEPCVIAHFLVTLSQAFNKFYHECNILNAKDKLKQARIMLVFATQNVIKDAMELLGIECPEEM